MEFKKGKAIAKTLKSQWCLHPDSNGDYSFTKRSCYIIVTTSRSLISIFDLSQQRGLFSSVLIQFHLISREKLGKLFILFNLISSDFLRANRTFSVSFLSSFLNSNLNQKSERPEGDSYGKDTHCET